MILNNYKVTLVAANNKVAAYQEGTTNNNLVETKALEEIRALEEIKTQEINLTTKAETTKVAATTQEEATKTRIKAIKEMMMMIICFHNVVDVNIIIDKAFTTNA